MLKMTVIYRLPLRTDSRLGSHYCSYTALDCTQVMQVA